MQSISLARSAVDGCAGPVCTEEPRAHSPQPTLAGIDTIVANPFLANRTFLLFTSPNLLVDVVCLTVDNSQEPKPEELFAQNRSGALSFGLTDAHPGAAGSMKGVISMEKPNAGRSVEAR